MCNDGSFVRWRSIFVVLCYPPTSLSDHRAHKNEINTGSCCFHSYGGAHSMLTIVSVPICERKKTNLSSFFSIYEKWDFEHCHWTKILHNILAAPRELKNISKTFGISTEEEENYRSVKNRTLSMCAICYGGISDDSKAAEATIMISHR